MRFPIYRPPTPPGVMLLQEFLIPMELTQVEFARRSGVSARALNEIIKGKRAVTARTSILISKALKTTPELWIDLQTAHDLWWELGKQKAS
jgi:antitoxin HigA-1